MMKNGRISEEGTHEELMAKSEEYYSLITFVCRSAKSENDKEISKWIVIGISYKILKCSWQ